MKLFVTPFLLVIISLNISNAQPDSVFYNEQIDSLIQQVNPANITQYISDLASANGNQSRVTYTVGNAWAAGYIKQQFDSFTGLTTVEFDTFYNLNAPAPWNFYPLMNVVATLDGSGPANRYYIIGGHFDTSASLDPTINWQTQWATAIAPGADDNASGVASVLEIARILSDPSNQLSPDISIKFIAFGAEESSPVAFNANHRGSHHFASTVSADGDQIEGVYNIDMIGYNNTGNHYYNIVSNSSSLELGDDLIQANQLYQIGLNSNNNPFTYATYSDHEQFWQYGYSAVLLIENAPPWNNNPPWYNANPYYHKAQDTPDKVNIPQITKITKATLAAIACRAAGITSIADNKRSESLPEVFLLQSNFPNPFNARTVLNYQLLIAGNVKFQIFNSLGEEVDVLVNSWQPAGDYRASWEGTDQFGRSLPSGIYLARLQVNQTIKTQKMMLIK